MKKNLSLVPIEQIENIIYIIREQKIIFDADLAMIYGVRTKALNQAVDRNISRFPLDFAFHLTKQEWNILKSQIVTSNDVSDQFLKCQIGTSRKENRGGKQKLPRVFTEHGAYAVAFVLRSPRAQMMSVEVVRAFVRMRQWVAFNEKSTKEFQELRSFVLKRFNKTDQEFAKIWRAFDKLLTPPHQQKGRIGFDWGLD